METSLFKKEIDKINFKGYEKQVGDGIMIAKEYVKFTEDAAKKAEKHNKSFEVVGLKNIGKKLGSMAINAFADIGVSMLAGLAVEGILHALDEVINRQEKIIEKGKVAQQSIADVSSDYDTKKSTVDQYAGRYDELVAGVNRRTNENASLSNEEYKEFLEISSNIASLFPELISGYDSQGRAILNLGGSAGSATEQLAQLLDQERLLADFKIAKNLQDAFDGVAESNKILEEDLEKQKKKLSENKKISSIDFSKDSLEDYGFKNIGRDIFNIDYNALGRENAEELHRAIRAGLQSADLSLDNLASGVGPNDSLLTIYGINENNIEDFTAGFIESLKASSSEIDAASKELMYQMSEDEREIAANWKSMIPSLVTAMGVYDDYDEASDTIKQMINTAIGEIDFGSLDQSQRDNIRKYARQTFLDPISDMDTETRDAFNKITEVYSDGEKSLQERYDQINRLLSGKGVNKIDARKAMRALGIDDIFASKIVAGFNDPLDMLVGAGYNRDDLFKFNDQELEIAFNLVIDDGFDGDIEKLRAKVEEEMSKVQEISEKPISFSSLFTTEDGEATDFSKKIDDFQNKISSLQSTMDSLRNGEKVNLTDLFQEFPELIGQTEDLSNAITSLQEKTYGDAIAAIFSQAKDLDSSQMPLVEEFVQSMLLSADLSNVDFGNIKNQIISSLMPTAEDAIGRRVVTDSINAWFANVKMPDLHDIIWGCH